MSNRKRMSPPFYILINDTDKHHIKFYLDVHFQGVAYEGEINNRYADVILSKDKGYPRGPRRMKHIETAIKFRKKIAGIKELDRARLKIVLVERSLEETFKKIEQQAIRPFTFGGVFK